eukprot:CAMPEP_0194341740 /NCGR_PEP_ID=MMETSP0171-20130528/90608_1 /TAXON_ID=218684 /ORGANISM="Corethron pennatum, Strain L29A3" /LENGTH=200 /DNA_ID=CAMNT_0039107189 /DNA_START=35 /DNA_END=634 /DNA_ORIENTATION=-
MTPTSIPTGFPSASNIPSSAPNNITNFGMVFERKEPIMPEFNLRSGTSAIIFGAFGIGILFTLIILFTAKKLTKKKSSTPQRSRKYNRERSNSFRYQQENEPNRAIQLTRSNSQRHLPRVTSNDNRPNSRSPRHSNRANTRVANHSNGEVSNNNGTIKKIASSGAIPRVASNVNTGVARVASSNDRPLERVASNSNRTIP